MGAAVRTMAATGGWAGDTPRWLLDWSAGRSFHEDPRLDAAVRAITSSLSEVPAYPEPMPALEPSPALSREVATEEGVYLVRGSRVSSAGNPVLLVMLERRPHPLPPLEELCQRHGFTRKEARVAALLSEGKTNVEIADELFISAHTARHHTESVLLKLGVHSRREVSAALLHKPDYVEAA